MSQGTYYKYAERNVDSQVNWAEIGKNMTDMLQEEARIRREKKAALDERSRKYGEELANAPTGDYDAGNGFSLDMANTAQEARRMQDVLLKSGQLSVRDYTIMRQNTKDGTTRVFDLSKEYQAEYAEKMARWDGDESSFREVWEMEQAEGLANLRNVGGYINPTNGVVSIAKRLPDGTMSTNQNEFSTVAEMRDRLKMKYDRFDADGYAIDAADGLGEVVTTQIINGVEGGYDTIKKYTDAKKGDYKLKDEELEIASNYKEWEENTIDAAMVNPNDVASILTDAKRTAPNGKKYDFTFDKNDVVGEDGKRKKDTEHIIFIDRSENAAGTVKATEEQEEVVRAVMRTKIRSAIDEKVESTVSRRGYEPTGATSAGATEDREVNIVSNIGALYYGDDNELKTAMSALRGINPNIKKINRTADGGVVVTFADDSTETLSFKDADDKTMTQQQFIESAANKLLKGTKFQIANYDEIAERGKLDLTRGFNETSKGTDEGTQVEKLPFNEAFARTESKKLDITAFPEPSAVDEQKEATAVGRVRSFIASLEKTLGASTGLKARRFNQMASGYGIVVEGGPDGAFEIKLSDYTTDDLKLFRDQIISIALESSLLMDDEAKKAYVERYGKTQATTEGGPAPTRVPRPQ